MDAPSKPRPTWEPERKGQTIEYQGSPFWFYFKADADAFVYRVRVPEVPVREKEAKA